MMGDGSLPWVRAEEDMAELVRGQNTVDFVSGESECSWHTLTNSSLPSFPYNHTSAPQVEVREGFGAG